MHEKLKIYAFFLLKLKIEISIVLSFILENLLFLVGFYGIICNPCPTTYHLMFSILFLRTE